MHTLETETKSQMGGCRKASQYQNPRPSRCCSRSTKPSAFSLVPLLPDSLCRWKFLQMGPSSDRSCYSATSNWTLTDDNTAFMAAQTHDSPSADYGTGLTASMQMIYAVFTPRTQQQTIGRVRGWLQSRKILNRPKEMNAVSTKVVLLIFPPVCPFAQSISSQVTPRHVLHSQPHIIWHVLTLVTSHNMPNNKLPTPFIPLICS